MRQQNGITGEVIAFETARNAPEDGLKRSICSQRVSDDKQWAADAIAEGL